MNTFALYLYSGFLILAWTWLNSENMGHSVMIERAIQSQLTERDNIANHYFTPKCPLYTNMYV